MQKNTSISSNNISERIITHPELINQEFLLIELDRDAKNNGFMIGVKRFDEHGNIYDMQQYSHGYDEYSEYIAVESDDDDDIYVKERKMNAGGVVSGFLFFNSNRTKDGIIIDNDYITDTTFVFYNSGSKTIKVDGNKIQSGEIFIETINTKERKQRRDFYEEAFKYLLEHYNDPDFIVSVIED